MGKDIGAVVVALFVAILVLAGVLSGASARRAMSARCVGWCEAHGYEQSLYLPIPGAGWSTEECWCAERVGPGAALVGEPAMPAPLDLPAEEPALVTP